MFRFNTIIYREITPLPVAPLLSKMQSKPKASQMDICEECDSRIKLKTWKPILCLVMLTLPWIMWNNDNFEWFEKRYLN